MKFLNSLVLITLVGSVAGRKGKISVADGKAKVSHPQLTVGMNVGEGSTTSALGGLEPKMKWEGAGVIAGCDVEGGIDVDVTSVDEPPNTAIWGKIKRTFKDFGDVSIRGDMDAADPEFISLDIRANSFGTGVQLQGSYDASTNTADIARVQLTRDIDTMGGVLSVNPLYNVKSSTSDVRVGYAIDNTKFTVDAEKRKLTVSHDFGRDTLTPSLSAYGDFSLSYSRDLPSGKITTSWTPNDSLAVTWTDGEWQTTVKAPIEGYYNANQGIKVNMKRTVGVF